ncbi:thioredoxin family protein, partial [Vibrio genomosp. F10]|uniref:thioredoxin family protein n=1 Tax=Vibrio genomosp. F10 TaxID=723171 RepID=UPI00240F3F25
MSKVKYLFGAMMLITSLWLLSLLTHHLPILWIVIIGVVSVVAFFIRTLKVYGEKVAAWVGGTVVVLLASSMVIGSVTTDKWATPLPAEPNWERLSTSKINDYVAQGKTVFVDVTAEWCISCKANKIGVVLQDPVYSTLQHPNVIAMQGNWTTPSVSVTEFLQSHGRFGVPFNVVYGP